MRGTVTLGALTNLRALLIVGLSLAWPEVHAQQTVFNVPSADVLSKGQVYFETDFSLQHSTTRATFTPRVVFGLGRNAEAGLNVASFTTTDSQSVALSPTFKWKAWSRRSLSLLLGDNIFIPTKNAPYHAGNYIYAAVVKEWKSGTRVSAGPFNFSAGVVAAKPKSGGQFTFEHPVSKRATLAADWFTGDHTAGYLTVGFVLKATPKLTLYPAYMIGNHGVTRGNHALLFEVGWSIR